MLTCVSSKKRSHDVVGASGEAKMESSQGEEEEYLQGGAFALRTQHLEDLVTEYLLQPLRLKMRRNPEHAIAIETTV
jgi:hypothetical protein